MRPFIDSIDGAQLAVKEFHKKVLPQGITFEMQFGKLLEEMAETYQARQRNDGQQVTDGLGDMFYVLLGLCNLHGISLGVTFNSIHDSNMTKTGDGTLSPKGAGYVPPDLR